MYNDTFYELKSTFKTRNLMKKWLQFLKKKKKNAKIKLQNHYLCECNF